MLTEPHEIFLPDCLEEKFTDMNELTGDNIWGGQILLVSDDPELRALYTHAIELLGGQCSPLSMDCRDDDLSRRLNVAAIIIHITDWNTGQEEMLGRAERFCEASNLPLLIRTRLNLLDFTLAAVKYPRVEYLLSDNVAELFVLLEHRTSQSASSLFADRDEIDLVDLKKISADVERIARALVQLSGPEQPDSGRSLMRSPFHETAPEPASEPAPQSIPDSIPESINAPTHKPQVRDPSVGYISAPSSNRKSPESGPETDYQADSLSRPISAAEVRGLIKARRLRDQYFDAELFADPAWDMLLDLMAARLEGIPVAVSSLCIAANVPPTTALRWIKTMTEEQIFLRKADEQDGRRIFIELSDEATAGMVGFFAMVRRSGLMLI